MTSAGTSLEGPRTINAGGKELQRQDVTFASEGTELSGWLYTPDSAAPWPIVVMAHGFSATRRMMADRFAEAICAAGLAVLLYDHRGFGASGGEPRHQINTWSQARGYRDAVAYATTLEDVRADRIAVWGDSLSGGSALAVAAIDARVAALVVQVPAIGSQLPPPDEDGALYEALKETILSGRIAPTPDEVVGPMPVVSDDQIRRPSALKPLTAYRWFIEYGGRLGSEWVNDVTRALPKTPVAWLPALCAPYVQCPSLFVVSFEDEMPAAVPAIARDAFDRLPGQKEWKDIPGGHFGLLYDASPEFEAAVAAQAEFLARHLLPSA